MEDPKKYEKYMTTLDLVKIPNKKMNYKQFIYRQRIKYGKYINMGLVNDKLKFCFRNGKLIYKIDESYNKDDEEKAVNEPFYKALYYCSELDFNIMPSKREINLQKLLKERVNKFKELTKKIDLKLENNNNCN